MSSYDARLGLPDQTRLPLHVKIDVTDGTISLSVGRATVAEWQLDAVVIKPDPRGFKISADGEELLVAIAQPNRFAHELGVDLPPN
jgi:hypothetical protein